MQLMEWSAGDPEFVRLSHNLTTSTTDFPLHTHNTSYEMMLILSGNVEYFINGTAYHLTSGNITFIRPNDIHGVHILDDTPYERTPIHFGEQLASSLRTKECNLLECFSRSNPIGHLSQDEMDIFSGYIQNMLQSLNKMDFGWDMEVRAYLTLALILANKALRYSPIKDMTSVPPTIQETLRFVDEHLSEHLDIQAIADHVNVSKSRLMHLFKESTGMTLWTYVQNKRIGIAKELLQKGRSITDACYESGFQDYSHFIKVFQKLNGQMTPGKFVKDVIQIRDID